MGIFESLVGASVNRDRIMIRTLKQIKDDFNQHGFLNIFKKELQEGILVGKFKTELLAGTVGKDDKNMIRVYDETDSYTVSLVG